MTICEFIATYLSWIISAITVACVVLQGEKVRWAWALSLGNQALWITWIWASRNWGFAPLTLALTFIYARNHFKWTGEMVREKGEAGDPLVNTSKRHAADLQEKARERGDYWPRDAWK